MSRVTKDYDEQVERESPIDLSKRQRTWIKVTFGFALLLGIVLLVWDMSSGLIYKSKLNTYYDEVLTEKSAKELLNNKENLLVEGGTYAKVEDTLLRSVEEKSLLPLSVDKVNEKAIVGGLHIPTAGITMPVAVESGVEPSALNTVGVLVSRGATFNQGNTVIVSNSSSKKGVLFTNLRDVAVGDKLYISDKETTYIFSVVDKLIVGKERTDLYKDKEGQTLLTLVTGYGDNERLVIVGEYLDEGEHDLSGESVVDALGR